MTSGAAEAEGTGGAWTGAGSIVSAFVGRAAADEPLISPVRAVTVRYGEHLDRRKPAAARRELRDTLPLEELHDEESGALLVHVVVVHLDHAMVSHAIGGVALALKPRDSFRRQTMLPMQDLHRDATVVLVSCFVNGGHSAEADEALDAPLSAEHRADSRFGFGDTIVYHRDYGRVAFAEAGATSPNPDILSRFMTDSSRRRRATTTKQAGPEAADPLESDASLSLVVVHSPDRAVSTISLSSDLTVVGRDVEGAGASVDDERMSRVHFRIAFDGRAKSHRLGDARSKNGTFVGGARVDTAVLRPGDVIRAGDTVFVYGDADPMRTVRERVARLGPSDLSVLLLGETGTGKERTAKAIHDASGRSGPFVAVNCAALPGALLGAELFGHTRGAFSGAVDARRGLFQTAHGGTLFLDEIADAPLDLQAVLLRALEERTVRPLGSDREVVVDTRVIAATHGDVDLAVREDRFRADLHARLAHAVVRLPPVRERRAEILKMASECAAENGRGDWSVTPDAAEALVRHSWRYNAREIENVVRGFITMGDSPTLDTSYLREHHPEMVGGFRSKDGGSSDSGEWPADAPDRALLESVLAKHRGNVSAVAEELGRPRAQVYRRLKLLGLDPDRYRS